MFTDYQSIELELQASSNLILLLSFFGDKYKDFKYTNEYNFQIFQTNKKLEWNMFSWQRQIPGSISTCVLNNFI